MKGKRPIGFFIKDTEAKKEAKIQNQVEKIIAKTTQTKKDLRALVVLLDELKKMQNDPQFWWARRNWWSHYMVLEHYVSELYTLITGYKLKIDKTPEKRRDQERQR